MPCPKPFRVHPDDLEPVPEGGGPVRQPELETKGTPKGGKVAAVMG